MRKREEGYVLLYVLVAISLLSVLAASICTITLRNLQTQHASVNRTEALYETEGKVEARAVMAQGKTFESGPFPGEMSAVADVKSALEQALSLNEGETLNWVEGGCEYTIKVSDPLVAVEATIFLPVTEGVTTIDPPADAPEGMPPTYRATLTTGLSEYRQYTVTDTAAG